MELQAKTHKHIREDHQGFVLTTIPMNNEDFIDQKVLINDFIKSDTPIENCRPDYFRDEKGIDQNLRPLFEIKKMSIGDFKIYDYPHLIEYLKECSENYNYTDGTNTFKRILFELDKLINGADADCFYLLNKEWFDNSGQNLREPEKDIFWYYYLILWVDQRTKTLNVCEWYWD